MVKYYPAHAVPEILNISRHKVKSNPLLKLAVIRRNNIKMGHNTCCVVNCKNNGRNSFCKFYTFPKLRWKLEQRKKWIAAVNRINADGSPWSPKHHDTICSGHFFGGRKSDHVTSPSYIPTIFPAIHQTKKIEKPQIVALVKVVTIGTSS